MGLRNSSAGRQIPDHGDGGSTGAVVADHQFVAMGRAVIEIEMRTLSAMLPTIGDSFAVACRHMLQCPGRIVVLGMGKSGHIGGKIAATLASTGTPAFFVHPGEASHGDMGMITEHDVVLAISNSGETEELVVLLPLIKRLGVPLIALTGEAVSTLANAATVTVDVCIQEEACPLGLAPTSSTTAALVMGDALHIALLEARGFNEKDFALAHPGGVLGRRLLLKISDIMHTGDEIPKVGPSATLRETLAEITCKGFGMTAVVDAQERVLGIFTDGDLRRAFAQNSDVLAKRISDFMTRDCKTVTDSILAAEALKIMQDSRINALLVVDGGERLAGVLNMHDLLRSRVM